MGESSESRPRGAAEAPEREDPIHPLIDLYSRYERRMYRQCLTQLRNPADAEDAVQETFARAALHLDQLAEDPAPYLSTVARNVCRDEMQRRARCISTGDPALFGEIEVGHAEDTSMDRDQLNAAWKLFTQRERQLIGRRFAGFSYDEIAGHLNMTTGALNLALARARKRARQVASVSLSGVLALLGLRRLMGRGARSAGSAAAMPSALLAATAVTCVVMGGGAWLTPQSERGAAVGSLTQPGHTAGTAPTSKPALSSDPGGEAPAAERFGVHPGGPAKPSSMPVAGLTASVVSPGQNATQQDAVFTSLTPSPSYQSDHTVFASGSLVNGCGRPVCPVIFRTQDGGASWQHPTAAGFLGGTLLLPPSYPADPVIFAASPVGLQRSDDGGASFQTVVPGPAPAAIDPRSPAGNARVLLAAQVPVVYSAGSRTVSAGPLLPAGVTAPTGVGFDRAGDVLFAADQPDPLAAQQEDGVIVRCPAGGACGATFVAANQPLLNLGMVANSTGKGLVLAWSSQMLAASRDGGATFTPLSLPGGMPIAAAANAPAGSVDNRVILAQQSSAAATSGRLAQSTDEGASFTGITPSGLAVTGISAMLVLPDGHELAALDVLGSGDTFGVRCSADGGGHWSDAC